MISLHIPDSLLFIGVQCSTVFSAGGGSCNHQCSASIRVFFCPNQCFLLVLSSLPSSFQHYVSSNSSNTSFLSLRADKKHWGVAIPFRLYYEQKDCHITKQSRVQTSDAFL